MRFALTLATALALLPAHLRAQSDAAPTVQRSQAAVRYKDPSTATLLGVLLPGAGQMYAGRTGKGLALLALSTGAVVTGAALSRDAVCTTYVPGPSSTFYNTECTNSKRGPLQLGVGVAIASWLYGAYSARGDARSANEVAQRHARATPVIQRMNDRAGLGLAYRF